MTPSPSKMRRFFITSALPSPRALWKPPMDPSDATTLCHGTVPDARPMAVPTARADVPSCSAMEPYDRTHPRGILLTTSYTRFWKGVRGDDPSSEDAMASPLRVGTMLNRYVCKYSINYLGTYARIP